MRINFAPWVQLSFPRLWPQMELGLEGPCLWPRSIAQSPSLPSYTTSPTLFVLLKLIRRTESCSDSFVVRLYFSRSIHNTMVRALSHPALYDESRSARAKLPVCHRHCGLRQRTTLQVTLADISSIVFSSSFLASRQRPWCLQRRQHRPPWLSHSSWRTTNCDPTSRRCRSEGEDRQCPSQQHPCGWCWRLNEHDAEYDSPPGSAQPK